MTEADMLDLTQQSGIVLNAVMWRLYEALYGPQESEEITAELEDILSEVEERLWILEDLRK